MFFFFSALHELLSDNLSVGLADHTPNTCIVCTPEAFSEDEVSRCIDNRKKKPQCTQLSGAKKDNQIKTQICWIQEKSLLCCYLILDGCFVELS